MIPDIRNLHKDFMNDIASVMAAEVEIVLGKYNRLCDLKLYGPRLQEFPLWSLLIPFLIFFYGEDLSPYLETFLQELEGRLQPEDGLEMQCRCEPCTNLRQYQSHILRRPYQ